MHQKSYLKPVYHGSSVAEARKSLVVKKCEKVLKFQLNVNTEERVVHEFPVKNKERKGKEDLGFSRMT